MIFFIEQELPHYRIPVFTALQEGIKDDLIICAGRPPKSADHITLNGNEPPFPYLELKTFWFAGDKLYVQAWWTAFRRFGLPDLIIVRHAIRNITLFPLIWFCNHKQIPVVLWGQGYSRNRAFNPVNNLFDKIHLTLIQSADAYVCYTVDIRDTLTEYIDSDKLFIATNTLDTRHLLAIRKQLVDEGKEEVKQRLSMHRKQYICFIGRLHPRKRIPYLLEVYALLKHEFCLDLGLVIIGKGDQRSLQEFAVKLGINDVHFLGALSDEEAGEYLFASDIMVIPGWLGLAINHAFTFGLPVVSQRDGKDLLGHGPESAYIQHGVTGWFAQEGDKKAMAQAIIHILDNQAEYFNRVSEYMDKYLHIERMVEGFSNAITYASRDLRQD